MYVSSVGKECPRFQCMLHPFIFRIAFIYLFSSFVMMNHSFCRQRWTIKLILMDYNNSRSHHSKKRTHSNSDDGKRKRLNFRHDGTSMSSEPVETIYRILCPVKRIGSVIGRGGDVVKALREETKAKIRVADSIPGADERIIIVFNHQNQSERAEQASENISNLEHMKPHCPAQDALMKIHDKIVEAEVLHQNSETGDDVIARILVPGNQVGCLLGKGGSIIQQLRSDTGAGIRVLPSENLPQCALRSDELVQISGAPYVVRKALYEISTRLHQHPRKEYPPLEEIIHASIQRKHESPPSLSDGNPVMPYLHADHPPPVPLLDPYRNAPLRYPATETEEFSIRILCASELIGSVIGKSGANVRQVEQQTGARILVQEVDKDVSGERLIVVASKEIPADPVSPTIEALILLHDKVSLPSEKQNLSTRLLVPSSKVGCIIGEGGKVITEMRRRTGAEIRVYSRADKPKYLSSDDELVQVGGPPAIARGALIEIASRLRTRTLRDASSANNLPRIAPFDGPSADILPNREFTIHDRSANHAPYGRHPIDPPYKRLVVDPPYGRSTNNPPYGRPAIDPPYGRPANDGPYGRPASDAPYGRPSSNIPYGRSIQSAPRDPSHAYPVDFFSKREYPIGSPPFVSNAPSSDYQRYAASARLPTRDPSSSSLTSDYMSGHSYRDHVLTDCYSSKGTQQLGVTRDGNSNTYDYTEAAEYMHGREDHRGLTSATATGRFSSTIELRIPNSYLESIIGVGGVNLVEIRQISGARLRILDTHAGSSESIVEIQGTLDQVKTAQSLLQGFISANTRSDDSRSTQQFQSSRMPHYPSWG